MTTGRPSLPYREMTEEHYAETAAAAFTISGYGAGMELLHGPCPRCSAVIDIPVFGEVVKGGGAGDAAVAGGDGEPVICTCDETHEGRPEGRVGCGAYWTFVL